MCGIAGAFFVGDRELVERFATCASTLLAHRGPDDSDRLDLAEGTLVHRRLSILDPTAAGRQPFASADGELQIVHNGEIYNYLELREELRSLGHSFTTDTDTEVILAAYRAWGSAAVERFNGIWAFALWDAPRRTLLLSRDRLGVKPLYLLETGGGLLFASEIKALRDVAPRTNPNAGAVRDYLWRGLVDHADATFYETIRPLPPATNVVVRNGRTEETRYWSITALSDDADPRPDPRDDERASAFDDLLRDAVALQLRSDVALGTCLSGGLDSATIVMLSSSLVSEGRAEHEAEPRVAVTAGFAGTEDDESAAAAEVARAAGIRHVVVEPQPGELVSTLEMLLREQDEPFISSSILAQRRVMEGASHAGVKVMLDGQGADELLGGYPHYRYAWLLGLGRARPSAVPAALRALRRLGIPPAVALRQALLAGLQLGEHGVAPIGRGSRPPAWLGATLRSTAPLPLRDAEHPSLAGTPLARHLRRAALTTSLPALLRYEDRNSMRFGIEARVPFLDHRVVEAAMLLPDRLKIENGVTKAVLRKAGIGRIPERIRTARRKVGFATPQRAWLEGRRDEIADAFAQSRAVEAGYLDRRGMDELLNRPLADDGTSLWRCLSVELWLRALT